MDGPSITYPPYYHRMQPSKLRDFLEGTKKESDTGKKREGRRSEGNDATHTSMSGGAWRIEEEDMDEFYRLYCVYIGDNCGPLHMTEKSTRIGAMRVDLDFKYDGRVEEHLHTQEQVINFVKAYMDDVKKFIVVPDAIELFISEKRVPTYYASKTNDKGEITPDYSKSGLHIVIPALKTNHFVEEQVRRNLVKRMPEFFPDLPLSDNWDKVYDPAPLNHNQPWTLLGSRKKEGTPYIIKYILDWNSESGEVSVDNNVPVLVTPDLLKKMTIRSSPSTETPMTEEAISMFQKRKEQEEVRASLGAQRGRSTNREDGEKRGSRASTPERNTYRIPLSDEMINYYRDHVMNLDSKRYTDYKTWIDVGICLKNIHPDSLETLFYDFSSKYEKYDPREAQAKWDSISFRTNGPILSERSLRNWSRTDNPTEYDKIEARNVDQLIEEAMHTLTEHDMAKVVFAMFRDEFKCSDYGNNDWYRFVGHVWKTTKKGVALLQKFSSDVWRKFLAKEIHIAQRLQQSDECAQGKKGCENIECERCNLGKRKDKCMIAQKKMKTTSFKKNVMEEARLLFLDEELASKLDTNKNLIAFNNGIFDTATMEFRDGKPEDYISFSTGVDYHADRSYKEYSCWNDLWKFLSSILPDEETRTYFLSHLSTCLIGGNPAQRFHILTGCGSNGKSMLMILMETCMGNYACKAPITLLTQESNKAGVANPEIVRMKGKRFVTLQEPEEGANIKISMMKQLSSGEKMTGRDLYAGSKEMVDIDVQAKYHLSCNVKPKVDGQDHGTWRRILVIDFPNKFVRNPKLPNELQDDKTIPMKVESKEWGECMMNYLINIFKAGEGFRNMDIPEKVLLSTREYKNETDVIGQFIADHITPLSEGEIVETPVTVGQINSEFQRWKRTNEITKGSTVELKKRIETQYTPYTRNGWTSFRFATA